MDILFEDFVLAPHRRELNHHGAVVALEPQVFDLLAVDAPDLGQGLRRVVMLGGGDEGRGGRHDSLCPSRSGSSHRHNPALRSGSGQTPARPASARQDRCPALLSGQVLQSVTSVPDATHVTVKHLGLPGAAVTVSANNGAVLTLQGSLGSVTDANGRIVASVGIAQPPSLGLT